MKANCPPYSKKAESESLKSNLIAFRLKKELEDKLHALAENKNKNITDTITELIESATRGEDPNRYKFLDTACPSLQSLNGGFTCCTTRARQKKLGDGSPEDAKKVCAGCQATQGILNIQAILAKGGTSTYHTCGLGGVIDEVDPDKILCPYETLGKHISITKDCNIKDNGLPCKHLQIHTIRIENIKAKTNGRK